MAGYFPNVQLLYELPTAGGGELTEQEIFNGNANLVDVSALSGGHPGFALYEIEFSVTDSGTDLKTAFLHVRPGKYCSTVTVENMEIAHLTSGTLRIKDHDAGGNGYMWAYFRRVVKIG